MCILDMDHIICVCVFADTIAVDYHGTGESWGFVVPRIASLVRRLFPTLAAAAAGHRRKSWAPLLLLAAPAARGRGTPFLYGN